jgi:predicted GIY-YIG superfamily endonuclease
MSTELIIKNPTYRLWQYIVKRHREGHLNVCEEWLNSSSNFLTEVKRELNSCAKLKAIDEKYPLGPSNWMWAKSNFQIALDYLVTINGIVKPAKEWAKEYNLTKKRIYERYWISGLRSPELITTPNYNKKSHFSIQESIEKAKQYKTRTEFKLACGAMHNVLYRNNLLEEACSHMETLGHKYKRYVYEIRLENTIYIGLTFNPKKREHDHISYGIKAVKELFQKGAVLVIVSDLLEPKKAGEIERKLIQDYKEKGFNVINSKRGGSLGACKLKWTKEEVTKEALKYKTKSDFIKGAPTAYGKALKEKYLKEICSHMISLKSDWSYEDLKILALKYDNLNEFMKKERKAYHVLARRNYFQDLISHMKRRISKDWTWESILIEMKKYNSAKEFRKNSRLAYCAVQSKNLTEKVNFYFESLQKL